MLVKPLHVVVVHHEFLRLNLTGPAKLVVRCHVVVLDHAIDRPRLAPSEVRGRHRILVIRHTRTTQDAITRAADVFARLTRSDRLQRLGFSHDPAQGTGFMQVTEPLDVKGLVQAAQTLAVLGDGLLPNRQDPVMISHLPRSNAGSVDRTIKENDMAVLE